MFFRLLIVLYSSLIWKVNFDRFYLKERRKKSTKSRLTFSMTFVMKNLTFSWLFVDFFFPSCWLFLHKMVPENPKNSVCSKMKSQIKVNSLFKKSTESQIKVIWKSIKSQLKSTQVNAKKFEKKLQVQIIYGGFPWFLR